MPPRAQRHQEFITGRLYNESFKIGNVKFDGLKNGVLLDAKSGYGGFIDKRTGRWHEWFRGQDGLINQARRQIEAAQGVAIEWHFDNEQAMKLIRELIHGEGLKKIKFVYTPR